MIFVTGRAAVEKFTSDNGDSSDGIAFVRSDLEVVDLESTFEPCGSVKQTREVSSSCSNGPERIGDAEAACDKHPSE